MNDLKSLRCEDFIDSNKILFNVVEVNNMTIIKHKKSFFLECKQPKY